jgi:hypothetical protein
MQGVCFEVLTLESAGEDCTRLLLWVSLFGLSDIPINDGTLSRFFPSEDHSLWIGVERGTNDRRLRSRFSSGASNFRLPRSINSCVSIIRIIESGIVRVLWLTIRGIGFREVSLVAILHGAGSRSGVASEWG